MDLTRNTPESVVQKSVLAYLEIHPDVALVYRSNSGAGHFRNTEHGTSRFVRFGFRGLSDITGMLKDGRALYVEVKSTTGKLSDEQEAFIKRVNKFGGVAFVARSIDDVNYFFQRETSP